MKKINYLKKIVAFCLILTFVFGNSLTFAIESNISGVTPIVTPNGNVYNIEGQQFSGNTQFRQYDNFNLSQGDIANLIYKMGYQNFVNLVNSRVDINGIVNTMQNNNFFNGHAIFVSPQGMVVGASGVLNVGSLSVLTPTLNQYNSFLGAYNSHNIESLKPYEYGKTQYNNLIQDSQGNIVVNGKIIARENVNLYGSNITLKKVVPARAAGIIAGYKGTEPIYDITDAEAVFNSLVSNNQINANGIELDSKGNINLVANKAVSFSESDDVTHDNLSEKVSASIKIDGGILASGNDITISSTANHSITTTADKLKSALSLKSILDPLSLIGINLNENFEGTRASSEIDVLNTKIYSANDTNITSNAVTNFVVTTPDGKNASEYIYGLGTETLSNINIKDSIIEAGNDFKAYALSENQSNLSLSNNLMFKIKDESKKEESKEKGKEEEKEKTASNMILLVNQTTKATTTATVDNSTINAKNASIVARNYNKDELELETEAKTKDKTGIAITALFKNQLIETSSTVKNSSKINSKNGDVNVISQNLTVNSNTVNMSINNDEGEEAKEESGEKANDISKVQEGTQKQMKNASSDSVSKKMTEVMFLLILLIQKKQKLIHKSAGL